MRITTEMTTYYLTRTVLSAGFAALLVPAGATWWMAAIVGALALAFFVWAPHSGRYLVRQEGGITPLRNDEMSQSVRAKAAGIAFAVVIPALAALIIYNESATDTGVPTWALAIVLALGAITYAITDFWLRRS